MPKLIGAFAFIIVFIVGLSFVLLWQLRGTVTTNQEELRVVPLAQYLKDLHDAELGISQKFFTSKSHIDEQKLSLDTTQFDLRLDSLFHLSERPEVRTEVNLLIVDHRQFTTMIDTLVTKIHENRAYDPLPVFNQYISGSDSIDYRINSILQIYIPSLSKALKNLEQQTGTVFEIGIGLLIISLLIGFVFAYLFTRSLIRPIKVLMGGTEKVGEGKYETVDVTTTDEIADLTVAFNLMSEKLKQLDEMRAALMSEISHEMRTPLQVIKAGCYSVIHAKDGGSLSQRQKDAVGMIHQATNRINHFVNSFLDIAKMEAGLMKFKFESTSLGDLLNPLVQEAELIANTRQIAIKYFVDQIPPLMIDRERMSQVFSNLLSNALKYTPDGGTISVRVMKCPDEAGIQSHGRGTVRIEIEDSGVGIPEDDLAKLFQKFYQAKNVPLVNEKGSGLGLALVKHVTEAHGGKVGVTSQVGKGSTFIITLPG